MTGLNGSLGAVGTPLRFFHDQELPQLFSHLPQQTPNRTNAEDAELIEQRREEKSSNTKNSKSAKASHEPPARCRH